MSETGGAELTEAQRKQFTDLRRDLLELHRVLMEEERAVYERVNGPITSTGEFFHLLVTHPRFLHLRAVSQIVTQMDELMDGIPASAKRTGRVVILPEREVILSELRSLLLPGAEAQEGEADFAGRYRALLRESSAVSYAHAAVMLSLNAAQS